ncbi:very short patch repair endonuclease [Candidatus Mycobacterium methanotrophicum]|uniref:Very short patch repair endonuclease n=1 Tax=Candidatus Mycobacterium methanotrophicum TaxID=2943498 RepID=A0ABY4QTI9_9MYCO|nr:DNA mismatch endonuclease Vsr [Candidatus Mycobacterium methanotrophicum]UQX11040.1 very short patch repair endonuclease [Candidatus Mycobacterium methanotrophicum]UQX13456.1 very short patch repair endonuclease [Candidatus Mycobacterium methanotrophicum]
MVSESWATTPAVRRSMRSNRSRDTRPELALRRLLFAEGLRYRVAARPLPRLKRTVDIVFRPSRVAVEMRGCFWHGCPQHFRAPASNKEYWTAKIARNKGRDLATEQALRDAGWLLVVVWEHDNLREAAREIASAVARRRR